MSVALSKQRLQSQPHLHVRSGSHWKLKTACPEAGQDGGNRGSLKVTAGVCLGQPPAGTFLTDQAGFPSGVPWEYPSGPTVNQEHPGAVTRGAHKLAPYYPYSGVGARLNYGPATQLVQRDRRGYLLGQLPGPNLRSQARPWASCRPPPWEAEQHPGCHSPSVTTRRPGRVPGGRDCPVALVSRPRTAGRRPAAECRPIWHRAGGVSE